MVGAMNSRFLADELSTAILHGDSAKVTLSLEKLEGWSVDELSELLVALARYGGAGWPSVLVKLGAHVNHIDNEGQTALSQCIHGMVDARDGLGARDTYATAAELLALGANPNGEYLGMSLILLGVLSKLPAFVALLVLAGGSLDNVEPQSVTGDTTRQSLRKLHAVHALGTAEWLDLILRKG